MSHIMIKKFQDGGIFRSVLPEKTQKSPKMDFFKVASHKTSLDFLNISQAYTGLSDLRVDLKFAQLFFSHYF